MNPLVQRNREAIRALGRRYGVARLEVFGSANTAEFDPDRSDVDFLVAYPPGYDFGAWMGRVQDLEADLSALLGRKVDLVMVSALENRWFRREAGKTREVVYDEAEDAERKIRSARCDDFQKWCFTFAELCRRHERDGRDRDEQVDRAGDEKAEQQDLGECADRILRLLGMHPLAQ